ncbi:thioesterase family protein [Roseivirga sp. E12]|uniref:acyl-CoA thioesterase n=1 Tax=Roseivirga sp. E12 TaxID=2819237 RepID=UPI001ABC3A10|nr:thioesterase family protein [Roseivirga sp. E12]MBO3699646.1 thioesterase family protein [Roseivirga sp. E12]
MSRIKITLPQTKVFETKLSIRISDINYGNHLGNDSVLSLMHEARFRFYKSLGYTDELSIDGVGTIQVDTAIQYKGEGFHGDEVKVEIYLGDTTSKSMDLYYRLAITDSDKLIALGKTGIAFYNYTEKKVSNMPDSIAEKLAGFTS